MLLSFCVFVKDDENFIGELLESVIGIADEIVIVDLGSADKTIEICTRYAPVTSRPFETFRIYEAGFTNFGNIRTLAAHLTRGEWTLMLDAGERISTFDLIKIRQLCEEFLKTGVETQEFSRELNNTFLDFQTRLFRNRTSYWYSNEGEGSLCFLSSKPPSSGIVIELLPKYLPKKENLLAQSMQWGMVGPPFHKLNQHLGSKTPSISFCMIVKNEAHCIEGLLQLIKESDIVNEMVIVDTGSTDSTPEICRKYTDRVYQVGFSNFSSMKTLAAHLARGEWVLMIDADERITLEDLRKLPELCNNKEGKVAFRFPRKRWLDLEMTKQTELEAFPDYQLRLFKNQTTTFFIGIIDECVRGLFFGTDRDIDPDTGPFIHHFQDVFHTPQYWQERRNQRIALTEKYAHIMEEHIFSTEIEDIKTFLGIVTKPGAPKG